MQSMSSPTCSVITVDDSNDEDLAIVQNQNDTGILSHESESNCSNQAKKLCEELPAKVLNSDRLEIEGEPSDSAEDTINESAPHGKLNVKRNSAQHVKVTLDSGTDMTGNMNQLKFADSCGRMYADAMSFSELQAQQLEFERLQAKAQRGSTSLRQATIGIKRKAHVADSRSHSSQKSRLQNSILKKTVDRCPFDFDSCESSDSLSSSSSIPAMNGTDAGVTRRKNKVLLSNDLVVEERKLAPSRRKSHLRANEAAPPKRKNKDVMTLKQNPENTTSTLFKTAAMNLPLSSLDGSQGIDIIDGTGWSESELDDNEVVTATKYTLKTPSQCSENSLLERIDKPVESSAQSATGHAKFSKGKSSKRNKAKRAHSRLKLEYKKGIKVSRSSSQASSVNNSVAAQVGLASTKLKHRRNARDTVLHSTIWRDLYFDSSQKTLLPLDVTVAPPFDSEFDQSLIFYDTDGDLESKCELLPQFEISMPHCAFASDLNKPEQSLAQEDLETRILDVIKRELPRLQACYKRKTAAVLVEARLKVQQYLAAHKRHRMQWLTSRIQGKRLRKDSLQERFLLNQMKRQSLTQKVSLGYTNVLGESIGVAGKLVVRDVNQLPCIRPLSKSTAYVGLKANIRVEDDPVLRYKPYFGEDDDGTNIDEAWYDAIEPKTSTLSSGLDSEVNKFLLRLVVREFGATEKVYVALKKVSDLTQAYSDYAEMQKIDASIRLAARRIDEAKDLISKKSLEFPLMRLAALEPALNGTSDRQKTLHERFTPPPAHFDSNFANNHAYRGYGLGLRSTNDYSELLVTYRDMLCRMCYDYHCLEHGIEHPLPSHRVDPFNPSLRFSAVALAASQNQDNTEELIQSSSNCDSAISSPVSMEVPGSGKYSAVDITEHEVVQTGDAVVADVVIEEDLETVTCDEKLIAADVLETRRSNRSATKSNSLATQCYIKQIAQPLKRNPSRPPRLQTFPIVADKSEYLDDSYFDYVSAIVKKSLNANESCSIDCWKADNFANAAVGCDEQKNHVSAVSETEIVLLQKLRRVIGENPCIISSMVKSTTCKEVKAFLEFDRHTNSNLISLDDEIPLLPDGRLIHNGRKRGRTQSSRNDNNRILLNRTKNNRLKSKGVNHEYEPCNHKGVCDPTYCSCMTRDHTCDKACSCSRDCPNRFPGCRCSLGNCRTKACPCFIAARECNPDLCTTCGASEVAALVFDEDRRYMSAVDLGICCNVNILRGLHKKIGMAYSTTHGWGAFALEPIKRGEFIYEYLGALLSQDEAERRGSIYDKMTISFLFDVNDDSVVDAIRKGNKSKFANHSTVNKKCKGKIMTVQGEHRISIWAQQDIAKGEELFFDYGYHGETAPDWSQLRINESAPFKTKKKTFKKDRKI
ncbi:putative SET domain, tesmin/TSO1-like CXC domain, pre-SET CXC domain-containing protein [Plasmopara halstedii]